MQDTVQEIKQRTDLVELISGYVTLRRSGRSWKGLCPFHAEKTPSFHVDPERGFWRCYGCSTGGDAFKFLERIENLTFVEAAQKLAQRLGLEFVPRGGSRERVSERQRLLEVTALAERFYREQLPRAPRAVAYLRDRGLTEETLERFRLGYAPATWEALVQHLRGEGVSPQELERAGLALRGDSGLRDRFVNRIIFPIWDLQGQPVAFAGRLLEPTEGVPKYINSPETPVFRKGDVWYGLHLAREALREAGHAVAVEGYMDVIACHQAGIRNVLAGMGTAITSGQVALLRRFTERLVLLYDGDSAGLQAALRAGPLFEEAEVEVDVAAPPAGDDPDTLLRSGGAEALHRVLESAKPLLEHRIALIRRRYNLSDAGQRLAMVREAAGAIAQSRSPLTRQAYATRLSEIAAELVALAPAERQMEEQAALLAEVRRLTARQEERASRAPARRGGGAGPAAAQSGTPRPSAAAGGLALAQRLALQGVLAAPERVATLRERLRVEDFTDETCRRIAAALLGNNGGETAEPAALLRDPSLSQEISALLVGEDDPVDDASFEDSVAYLETRARRARLRALHGEYEKGSLSQDDQRYSEYLQLARELKR